jgi:hypothetical protein
MFLNEFCRSLAPFKLTTRSKTVHGVWNATAGRNSRSSSTGSSMENYEIDNLSNNAFDGSVNTKYSAYGTCNSSYVYDYVKKCGDNTMAYIFLYDAEVATCGIQNLHDYHIWNSWSNYSNSWK